MKTATIVAVAKLVADRKTLLALFYCFSQS
jgi:hypothetical protein